MIKNIRYVLYLVNIFTCECIDVSKQVAENKGYGDHCDGQQCPHQVTLPSRHLKQINTI